MGMAASQARYLALVARKSNCEYEGQQINQARLNLSNQSANLFNQMLGLKVPVPPSVNDFTKYQYSFTDGVNAAVIDNWYQLAQPDSEGYNYVVDYHYNANVYTGSQKKMNDPQVQFTRPVSEISSDYTTQVIKIEEALKEIAKAQDDYDTAVDAFNTAYANSKTLSTYADNNLYTRVSECKYDAGEDKYTVKYGAESKELEDSTGAKKNYFKYQGTNGVTYYSTTGTSFGIEQPEGKYKPLAIPPSKISHKSGDAITVKYGSDTYTQYESGGTIYWKNGDQYYDMATDGKLTPHSAAITPEPTVQKYATDGDTIITIGTKNYEVCTDDGETWYYRDTDDGKYYTLNATNGLTEAQNVVDSTEGISRVEKQAEFTKVVYGSSTPIEITNAIDILVQADDKITVNDFYKDANDNLFLQKDLAALVDGKGGGTSTILPTYHISGATPEGQNWKSIEAMQTELNVARFAMQTAQAVLDNAKAYYDTLNVPDYIGNNKLTPLVELTEAQQAEIKQVIADMEAQDVNTTLSKYFDVKTNEYTGGIYQFTYNGITYYTTYDDMADSILGGTGINNIDDQPKLPYYRADYVSTRIDKEEKAILETDAQGRFTSVRLADNTAKMTLNVETITDDAAYNDAMNKYYYENAQYDKMVQDINAKTSVIHAEDRTLELRLKQLDTEHNALQNEIDAVQKVVKENVEKSFKTFSN